MCKKEKRKKKICERIKLLFEMRRTTERARILLGRGRHQELVKFEIAIIFRGKCHVGSSRLESKIRGES